MNFGHFSVKIWWKFLRISRIFSENDEMSRALNKICQKNASLLAIVAVDTAENEPSKVGDAESDLRGLHLRTAGNQELADVPLELTAAAEAYKSLP